jgi:CheY-like chemotaxis protein
MPEMDGYEATRGHPQTRAKFGATVSLDVTDLFIAMTANSRQGDREKRLVAGMDDYLSEPVRASDLQAVLERGKLAIQNQMDREANLPD